MMSGYNKKRVVDMNSKMFLLIGIALLMIGFVEAADESLDIGLDNNLYSPGETITVTGALYSGQTGLAEANVSLELDNTTTYVLTDSDGKFEVELTAPETEGEYNLTVTYGDIEIIKAIEVSAIDNVMLSLISSGSEPYEMMIFTDNMATAGITDDAGLTGTLMFANFTNNGTTYYAILQKEDESDDFDTLFISILDDFSAIKYQYLTENSKISLNSIEYLMFYIDPAGERAIILRQVEPLFYGTGEEYANLFILALNSTESMPTNLTTLTLEQYDESGEHEIIYNATITSPIDLTISQRYNNIRYHGLNVQLLNISETAGKHNLVVGNIGHMSYFVKKFSLKTSAETAEGSTLSVASPGQIVVLKSSVVDLDTGLSVADADVTVQVIYPDGTVMEMTLLPNSANIYTANFSIDTELIGDYIIIFTATYANSTITKEYKFSAINGKLFMKAFSPQKGEGNGFPPNSQGFILVGETDFATGEFANLSDLTNDCNSTEIYLKSILDEDKINRLTVFSTMTLSDLWNDPAIPEEVPDWVKDEMEDMFGEEACAIKFTTPASTGTYKLEVEANISGTPYKVKDYLDVTSLFVFGMPVNCNSGSWSDSVAPGSKVCIKVSVFDAGNGKQVAPANITDINLIEVYAMGTGVVTDEITNIAVSSLSNGQRLLTFYSSNRTLGDHDIKFRIKANTSNGSTTGIGHGWFRTQLWSVWTHPECDNNQGFCNFGTNSSVDFMIEAFSAGFGGGQADLTATLASIKNFDTGETLQLGLAESVSCTTVADNSSSENNANSSQSSKVMPATCSLALPTPDEGWDSGSYEVKFTVTDTDDNSMSIYSWFMVKNFRFWLWNRNWELSQSQNADFEITLQDFNNNDLDGTVSITKLYYMGTEDNWMQPREIEFNGTEQEITEGHGTYTIDSSDLADLKSGFYDVIFTATTDSGTQTARTGMNLRSFVVVANPTDNNQDRSYAIGDNLTINVSAFDNINWSTYPPTGTPHAISNVSVKKINKAGMWDRAYKLGSKLEVGDTNDCDGIANYCILTVPLTDYEQSSYDMMIEVADSEGNTGQTNYWFKTETYTITIPEIQDWRNIPASNKLTDKMAITLDTDKSCGTNADTITEPANVTNCLVDAEQRLPTIYQDWNQYPEFTKRTVFLFDKTDNDNPRLFVNYYNNTWESNAEIHYNFTLSSTLGPFIVGDTFTDTNGYVWNVTEFDTGLGKVTLKSVDGVIKSRTKQAENGNSETTVEYVYQYLVNKSLSQSGIFLYAGSSDNEDKFWDDQWANIDLDADGLYNCDPNTGQCEEYFMLLTDRVESDKYDTLLLSPTRNMSQGVDSNTGFSGDGDLRFNASATPVYLLNLIYSETNGLGKYNLVTTTNKAGWPGRNLGVFQVGSEHVKLAVMVASPSTKQGISNKTILIRTLRTYGRMNFQETALDIPVSAGTGDNGIAILDINVSNVETGEYLIMMEVNDSGNIITPGNDWDNPKIELRSFSISNLFGLKTTLNNVVEWSQNANNLFRLDSSEVFIGGGVTELRINCNPWSNEQNSPDYCHVDDWRYRELWVNLTDPNNVTIFKDNTPNDWHLFDVDINESTMTYVGDSLSVRDEFGGEMSYTFSSASLDPIQKTFQIGVPERVRQPGGQCDLEIELLAADGNDNTIRWTVNETCPWSQNSWTIENGITHSINEPMFLWGFFNISSISDGTEATFNVMKKVIVLSMPVSGIYEDLETNSDGRIRVVSNAFGTGYDLYIYDSNQTKTRNNLEGWSGGMYDAIAVINSSNDIVETYALGESIPEIGDIAVVRANPWERYVFLSNLTVNSNIIYPLPWACDDNKFYVGSFNEQALGFNLYDCMGSRELSDREYYIILFDSMCDGAWQLSSAKLDDDNIFDDDWINLGEGQWIPYDFIQNELGEENMCQGNPGSNQSEQWMDIGRESYPLSITNYNDLDNGNLDMFKPKWGINPDESVSALTLWVQAKNFDGTTINGTISVDKASGMSWGCGMSEEEDIEVITSGGALVNGNGYIDLDMTNFSSPQPTIKFKVQDDSNPLKYEHITKSFWYGPANMMMQQDEDCGDKFKGGGGSEGGPKFDEEGEADMQRCMANIDVESCQISSGCIWVNASMFGPDDPPENNCIHCIAFDGFEEGCSMFSNDCIWIPEGESGICDPAQ